MLGIEPRLATCKANTLLAILWFWPQEEGTHSYYKIICEADVHRSLRAPLVNRGMVVLTIKTGYPIIISPVMEEPSDGGQRDSTAVRHLSCMQLTWYQPNTDPILTQV